MPPSVQPSERIVNRVTNRRHHFRVAAERRKAAMSWRAALASPMRGAPFPQTRQRSGVRCESNRLGPQRKPLRVSPLQRRRISAKANSVVAVAQ